MHIMRRLSPLAWQWVCSWGAAFASHMRAFVALRLMPVAVARMPSFANEHLAESLDIRLWTTSSSQGHLHPLGSQSLRSPSGLARQDGKRPDGVTFIPWQRGKPLTWDVTVVHTLADSYVSVTARSGGAAAEQAAGRKTAKYDLLVQTGRLFQPIAAETLGPLNESSIAFFSELGRKIASISGDNREPSFLFQRISITVQRFNSIMLHNSFSSDEE